MARNDGVVADEGAPLADDVRKRDSEVDSGGAKVAPHFEDEAPLDGVLKVALWKAP